MVYVTSLETASLIALTILTICDVASRLNEPSIDINQLETFDQLASSIEASKVTNGYQSQSSQDDTNSVTTIATERPICPIDRDRLKYFHDLELDRWLSYQHIEFGGHFKPFGCVPKQLVAIIIPYRDEQEQLEKFLFYIHQFLPDQLINYKVFVVEQGSRRELSRTKLFNIGTKKIMETDPDISCFIFHDVDLMPLDQKNLYMCSKMPRHLSGSISSLRYRLIYPQFLSGVISLTKSQYTQMHGFSNHLMNWIDQDENTLRRVLTSGLMVERTPLEYGVYITTSNKWSKRNLSSVRIPSSSADLGENSFTKEPTSSMGQISCQMEPKHLYTLVKCEL